MAYNSYPGNSEQSMAVAISDAIRKMNRSGVLYSPSEYRQAVAIADTLKATNALGGDSATSTTSGTVRTDLDSADPQVYLQGSVDGLLQDKAEITALNAHTNNTTNPHATTKAQVGLSDVSNDAQLKIASNLSDLENASAALGNLGGAPLNSPSLTGEPRSSNVFAGSKDFPPNYSDKIATTKFTQDFLFNGRTLVQGMTDNISFPHGTNLLVGSRWIKNKHQGGASINGSPGYIRVDGDGLYLLILELEDQTGSTDYWRIRVGFTAYNGSHRSIATPYLYWTNAGESTLNVPHITATSMNVCTFGGQDPIIDVQFQQANRGNNSRIFKLKFSAIKMTN